MASSHTSILIIDYEREQAAKWVRRIHLWQPTYYVLPDFERFTFPNKEFVFSLQETVFSFIEVVVFVRLKNGTSINR